MDDSPPRVVVCLHGFLRTGASMAWLGSRLRTAGYAGVSLPTFGYHLRPLSAHAERASELLQRLHEQHPDATIDIVSHSMGGLLTRATLARADAPPVRRVVMLSPPNQGAMAAHHVRSWLPVHRLGWDPLHELLPGVASEHPSPPCEVGVLTGGTGQRAGYNRLLGDDNDFMVRVDEAQLAGTADFHVIPVPHALMPFHSLAARQVVAFFATGRFFR